MRESFAELLERGYLAAHLNRLRPFYRARRDALCDGLRAHLPRDVRWQRPVRGLSVWLELPEEVDPERVFEEGLGRGVLVAPGRHFAADEGTRPGLRLNFCSEPEGRLALGAERVAQAIEAVRQEPRADAAVVDVV